MAMKKSGRSVQSLTGMAGGAPAAGAKASSFPKESESVDHKTGKDGRVRPSKVKPVSSAKTEARKGGASPARETHNRSSVAASGKKGK